MTNRPNPNLLRDMYLDILKMEHKEADYQALDLLHQGIRTVELRQVKEGEYFKRKPHAKTEYIRNHYNRKDQFGPANFSCTSADDINREIFLKPSTIVYVEWV